MRGLPNGIGGAVVVGDHIYGTEAGQKLVAAEFTTGKVKWQADGLGWSSVASADGLLFLHGLNGQVALVEATPEGYRERGTFELPKLRGGGNTRPPPVICDGKLYVRDQDTLLCYDVKAR